MLNPAPAIVKVRESELKTPLDDVIDGVETVTRPICVKARSGLSDFHI